jgi:GxxExxY protein
MTPKVMKLGACMEVYQILGNGFLEAVYQECPGIELLKRKIPFESQKPLTLSYIRIPNLKERQVP